MEVYTSQSVWVKKGEIQLEAGGGGMSGSGAFIQDLMPELSLLLRGEWCRREGCPGSEEGRIEQTKGSCVGHARQLRVGGKEKRERDYPREMKPLE